MESLNRCELLDVPDSPAGSTGASIPPDLAPSNSSTLRLRLQRLIPCWLWELTGYGLVSVIALAADTLILRGLVRDASWRYIPASIASFITGAVVAYFLSTRFVFGSHRIKNRAMEFSLFVILGVFGLGVNTALLWLVHGILGVQLVTSKMVAAVGTFTTNFLLRRGLLFSSGERECHR